MSQKKSLFEYDNYREYLRDYYRLSKEKNKKFSLGYFSRVAGFKSRSVLRQVMAEERNIAPSSIEKFSLALKLTRVETVFFRNLVLFNQASSADEKLPYLQEIMRLRHLKNVNPVQESEYNYFSKWFYVVIRELASVRGFRNDPIWIAKQIRPNIRPSEAKQAVEDLIKLGYLKLEVNGDLRSSQDWLSTGDEVVSAAIVRYHQAMIQRGAEAIARYSRERRDISAQTFAVSENTAKEIKVMIQDFRKAVESIASKDEAERDSVYQLNFQLFPVAQVSEE